MNLAANPMTVTSSSGYSKSGDGGQFPAGLRVLVVDDDLTCLKILETMLRKCHYEVTKNSRAEVALKLLRDNKEGYDIVLSDVHMPDMDGFKLLEHVGLEMDLPVIMMSADDSKDVVMKGVTHGACDYLIKPIRMEALKNIWQHVVRRKQQTWKEREFEHSGSEDGGERAQRAASEDADCTSSANEGRGSKRRKDEEDDGEERDDSSTLKKPRVVWSVELHQQFVNAVNQLGIDKAVPKKILELMNVPGLTRENVASHLQKYRLYLRRLSLPQQGGAFIHEGPFGALAPLQGMLMEQRNMFSFESPKIRFMNGQQQNEGSKQTNLLHGIPTNMDSKQLAALNQPGQAFVAMNTHLPIPSQSSQGSLMMPQMVRNQLLNKINSGHVLNLQSSLPSGIMLAGGGFGNAPLPNLRPGNTFLLTAGEKETKGSSGAGFGADYDALNRNRVVGPSFQAPMEIPPSVVVRPAIPSVPAAIKALGFPDIGFQGDVFGDQFEGDDLMSALLKQQFEGDDLKGVFHHPL